MRLTSDAARLIDWMRFDRRDFGLAVALSVASLVINTSGAFRLLQQRSPQELAQWVGQSLLTGVVGYVVLVMALEALERVSIQQGWRRHLATIATGMTVAAATTIPVFVGWPGAPQVVEYGIVSSPLAFLLYAMWLGAAFALIARAWLVRSRDEIDASNLLARIRSEQMSVRRRVVEGRLKSIQARVDPLFFFDMLEAVRKTYSVDAARAEQLLDELTTFLRAALPRLRTVSSSVDQECELASSFARLSVLSGRGTARLDVDVAQSVGGAAFPPGVLLPLVDELLRTAKSADSVGISFLIDGEGQIEPARRTVVLHLNAQRQPSDETVARTRATLFDLFGATATIAGRVVDGVVRTTVRVPYEPASA